MKDRRRKGVSEVFVGIASRVFRAANKQGSVDFFTNRTYGRVYQFHVSGRIIQEAPGRKFRTQLAKKIA